MAQQTFFFYDLETSGKDPRTHRIMQFAGQRTDMNLNPLGDPMNIVVRLDREIIPEPQAILITGITPQYTVEHGIPERDAIRRIMEEAFTSDTIATGFNNVRFDDEFMRFTAYRNFHDPYEWSWYEGRSRWDMLDVVRLVRALKPEGIGWPVDQDGKPINKLGPLAAANNLSLERAHDAMSDVFSLIDIARLIRDRRPKMFDFLLNHRLKNDVAEIVNPNSPKPFVYASGIYGADCCFTTVAYPVGFGQNKSVIAYDLRQDPSLYTSMTVDELRDLRFMKREDRIGRGLPPFPAKHLHGNKCPAVAPYGALTGDIAQRLGLDKAAIARHAAQISISNIGSKLIEIFSEERQFEKGDVDGELYSGFFSNDDKLKMPRVRNASPEVLKNFIPSFKDKRLTELFQRYKAHNAPEYLTEKERSDWNDYCTKRRKLEVEKYSLEMAILTELEGEDNEIISSLKEWASEAF